MRSSSEPALDALLRHPALWRAGAARERVGRGIPTGFPVLDAALPGGGWPPGALTEILTEGGDAGAVGLLLPALARLGAPHGRIAWIDPPHVPYAPALAGRGIAPERVLVVRTAGAAEGLWAAQQALRSGACAAVLAWLAAGGARGAAPAPPRFRALRRLQLAAEAGGAWGVVLGAGAGRGRASPAALRLAVAPVAGGLRVEILKGRGAGQGAVLRVAPPAGSGTGPTGTAA